MKVFDGMSFGCKIAWALVAFTFMFVFLPAAVPPQNMARQQPPEKKVYKQPLTCYKGELGSGAKKLICDYPSTPSVWTPPPTH